MSAGFWRVWHLRDGWLAHLIVNGNIIMSTTRQGYSRRRGALRAIEIATGAPLVNIDGEYRDYLDRPVRFGDGRAIR